MQAIGDGRTASRRVRPGRFPVLLARGGKIFILVQLTCLLVFLAVHRFGGTAGAETALFFASAAAAWGGIALALVLAVVGMSGSRSTLIWTGAALAIVGFVGIIATSTVTPRFLMGT